MLVPFVFLLLLCLIAPRLRHVLVTVRTTFSSEQKMRPSTIWMRTILVVHLTFKELDVVLTMRKYLKKSRVGTKQMFRLWSSRFGG